MLLTKTQDGVSERAGAARPRLRRLAGAATPTMDRRAFLKRSGVVAGAGAFASQLPFNLVGKAEAARPKTRQDRGQAHRLHALLGRLRDRRGGRRTASGCARSRCSIRRSTSARTAPRARRCASTACTRTRTG